MQYSTGKRAARTCDGITRRDFLQAGVLGAAGLTVADLTVLKANGAVKADHDERSVIMIFNLGAPSQIDTFDMKPDAPAEIRGPFKPIATKSPGLQISELFPLHAKHGDKFSLVRSCYHTAAAVHDTGHQMMQTGRLASGDVNSPHAGCVLGYLRGGRSDLPPHVVLPQVMGNTGGGLPHGQDAGFLGKAHDPFVLKADPSQRRDTGFQAAVGTLSGSRARAAFDVSKEPRNVRERYGMNRFGQSCLMARRLIEAGVRFVTVNTFLTVFNETTWDIHGTKPFTSIEGMKNAVAPMYDRAYTALLEDLHDRGLLGNTLVCNLAEFGRTPQINPAGGRDHWPQCWTVYFAGGGVRGGRVIGRSDATGGHPAERPVAPAEVVATIYHSLGLKPDAPLPGPDGQPCPLVDRGTKPIFELF